MDTLIIVFILSLSLLALGLVTYLAVRGIRAYFKARGKRLITCPENQCAAAVELDAKGAGWKALRGESYMRLHDCSRWPEKAGCAQDCLQQIETLGQGCLVGSIVASWYHGKTCFYCHKPVDKVEEWTGHIPALLGPDMKTVTWGDIPPEKLPKVFENYKPVCWSCHIAETFRREHADLVTDRPARW